MRCSINILLLILLLSTAHNKIYSMPSRITADNVTLGICGMIATLIMGKALCTLYFDHFWPTHYLIDHSYASFETISKTIERYKNEYAYLSQLGDWTLREEIYAQRINEYPFIEYHSKIARSLFELDFYLDSLQKSLRRIRNRQHTINSPVYDNTKHQTLLELEKQGMLLMNRLKRTARIMKALQKRVALMREYHCDQYNWSVEQQMKEW